MDSDTQHLFVAIDGPSASGKSTVSRKVAECLNYIYVDSGSFYRAVTWATLEAGVSVHEPDAVIELLARVDWSITRSGNHVLFLVDGVHPGDDLRSQSVRENVSDIAAIPEVRHFIVEQLRKTMDYGHVVMEGRDIGTVVCPETPYKYYLDASPEERARRRHLELVNRRESEDVHQVLQSLRRRDAKDTGRKTAPLQIALGAMLINSTDMDVDAVVEMISNDILKRSAA